MWRRVLLGLVIGVNTTSGSVYVCVLVTCDFPPYQLAQS